METRSENNPTSENAGKHGESDQYRAKLSKSKQKNCGLLSTLNWKIALTSGVGF